MRKIIKAITLLAILASIAFFYAAGHIIDQQMNVHLIKDHGSPDPKLKAFHNTLAIADWHADNLLWDRNPLARLDHGHIDVPRLIEGNVTLQVFDAVIKTPKGQNYQSNTGATDNITALAIANRWPIKAWFSLLERALYQSKKLHLAAANSNGNLVIIKSQGDLKNLVEVKSKTDSAIVGGMLSIEGLHALEGKLENLEVLYKKGYRMMGLVHFFDNEVGGSSAGANQGGLTPFGRQVIKRMDELGIIIDLAHASPTLISEVLELTSSPCVVSHTGVRGQFETPRNLSDNHLSSIAKNGGMIGIGFWDGAVGNPNPSNIVKAMKYAVSISGINHICLGSDWDGGTKTYFDAANLWVLTKAMREGGFSDDEISKIMGGNQLRFLSEALPSS
ncbi:MAG: membrane dipeptidase [Saprospiraceae bacterium]|jgi:membrane dipeptidase